MDEERRASPLTFTLFTVPQDEVEMELGKAKLVIGPFTFDVRVYTLQTKEEKPEVMNSGRRNSLHALQQLLETSSAKKSINEEVSAPSQEKIDPSAAELSQMATIKDTLLKHQGLIQMLAANNQGSKRSIINTSRPVFISFYHLNRDERRLLPEHGSIERIPGTNDFFYRFSAKFDNFDIKSDMLMVVKDCSEAIEQALYHWTRDPAKSLFTDIVTLPIASDLNIAYREVQLDCHPPRGLAEIKLLEKAVVIKKKRTPKVVKQKIINVAPLKKRKYAILSID